MYLAIGAGSIPVLFLINDDVQSAAAVQSAAVQSAADATTAVQ